MNEFHPKDCQFEILGFVEEFDDAVTYKVLGSRPLKEPTRPCGSPGRMHYTTTEPLQLVKGYKETPVTIKPGRKVIATIQIICGRVKEKTRV